jgi:hypothetical protein
MLISGGSGTTWRYVEMDSTATAGEHLLGNTSVEAGRGADIPVRSNV